MLLTLGGFLEDSYCKVCLIDGVECTLDITDTAGQEEYRCVFPPYRSLLQI